MESSGSHIDLRQALDAPISASVKLDTRHICDLVSAEIKKHSISQNVFAETVIGRSQGTLSDLLKKPKPWDSLKSGKKTFVRMYNWTNMSLEDRLAILEDSTEAPKRKLTTESGPVPKRTRLVFTEVQKEALDKIYGQLSKPRPEMEKKIADHLNLSVSTVHNYFQNRKQRAKRNIEQNEDALEEEIDSEPIDAPGSSETPLTPRHDQDDDDDDQLLENNPMMSKAEYRQRYLEACFKEDESPSKEKMVEIAEEVDSSFQTVKKFFENARQARRQNDAGDRVQSGWNGYYGFN